MERHILIVDREGGIRWSDMISRGRFSELGSDSPNLMKLFSPSSVLAIEMALKGAIEGGREERVRAMMLSRSGNEMEVNLELVPLVGNDDLCAVTFTHQIPRGPPNFQELQDFVQTMDQAMESVNSPIISADRSGKILMLNQSAEEQTGYSTKEVIGKEMISMFAVEGDSLDELKGIINRVLSGEVKNFSAPLRVKNGEEVQESWRLTYTSIGEDTDGIIMAFSYDPSSMVARNTSVGEVDENLLLLVTGSSHLIGSQDVSSVEEGIERLVKAQSLSFGILRVEGLEGGTITYSAGLRKDIVDDVIASPVLDLEGLTNAGSPSVIEFDTWAYRGKMPQEVNSVLFIPLDPMGAIRGFAIFGTKGSVRRWTSRTPILQIFSNQTLAFLRNSEMISTLTRRTMELQSIYDISQILSSTLDLDTLLDHVVDKGRVISNATRCSMYRWNVLSGELELLRTRISEGAVELPHQDLEAWIQEVMDSGRGKIFNKLPDDTVEEGWSFMVLPLAVAGESIGAMVLERKEPCFDDYDMKMMGHFTTTSTLAIRNANLYESVNRIASELQAYNDLMAHDIANYNVPIHGYLEMLLSEPHLNEKQKGYVIKALKQSENITSLVTNVRKLAEIRLKDASDLVPVDIVDSLERTIRKMSSSPICQGIPVTFENHPDVAYGLASDGINELFGNLLANACLYGNDGEIEIEVSTHQENGKDFWKIDFMDRGEGIPDEWKERIFTRFWEGDSDRRAEAKGLGLSVVRALCIRYGGKAWVSDRFEGDPSLGSTFSVTIPSVKDP